MNIKNVMEIKSEEGADRCEKKGWVTALHSKVENGLDLVSPGVLNMKLFMITELLAKHTLVY